MAVNINLLPSELKISKTLSNSLSILRMVGVIALAGFLVFGLGIAAFFIFSRIELNSLNSANDNLKSQISSLNKTESQFVLLKDRAAKIMAAQKIASATKTLVNFEPYIKPLQDSTVSELDVLPDKISTSITFRSNSDLKNFISAISASSGYKDVNVGSFGFSPTGGYSLSISVNP